MHEEKRHQEGKEDHTGNGYRQAESFKPSEDPGKGRGEEGVPVSKAEEDSCRAKIRIDLNLSPLHRLQKPSDPSFVQTEFQIAFGDQACLNFSRFKPCRQL